MRCRAFNYEVTDLYKSVDYKTFFLNQRKRDQWIWWRYWIHGPFDNRFFR